MRLTKQYVFLYVFVLFFGICLVENQKSLGKCVFFEAFMLKSIENEEKSEK